MVSILCGRRTKWAIVVGTIALVAVVGPLAGKLPALEQNSPDNFLPSGAASTKVLQYQEAHAGKTSLPAVVVFSRARKLSDADRAAVARARTAIAASHLAGAGRPSPTITSRNGHAAYFAVPISANLAGSGVADDVRTIRSIVEEEAVSPSTSAGPSGRLGVAVGGPAGAAADAADAFGGIDKRLLVVTVLIVVVLLLLIYRSPILWILPLISVLVAASWSEGFAYFLARAGFVVNGMTVGILTVLVFGAGTDYALLLIARYREELHRHADRHHAMASALRRAGPAIATSSLTVILSLLCLALAQLKDIAALGPVCAAGIFCTLVAQLVFLPALLLVAGRKAFWPAVPASGDQPSQTPGLWARLARRLPRHPRRVWVALTLALGILCLGLFSYRGGVNQQNGFRTLVGSVRAEQVLAANFPAGDSAPATVLVPDRTHLAAALAAARATPGVASVGRAAPLGTAETFEVVLEASPTSDAAQHTVTVLRHRLAAAAGDQTLVGGETATNVDLAAAAVHDRNLLVPLVLAVVLVMLGLLLRSLLAPVLLVATVLLSYLASLGVSAVVFRHVFGFPGFDPTVPIFGFVFLVALGVDYNIFLMARVREEAEDGAESGVVRGLAVTGSVITSAGIVLAATFSVLGVLPLIALTEVGFLVAFGVLLDTVVVRSALVPALALDIGPPLWWPSTLVDRSRHPRPPTATDAASLGHRKPTGTPSAARDRRR
ncbi:MAG: MMPL family transporter [Acidimicrobiales bacterium]